MSDPKPAKPSSPDSLIKDLEPKAPALDKVSGGRSKSADKQRDALDAFIKG